MRALCSVTLKQHIIRYVNRVEQQYTEIYTNSIYTKSPLQTKWEARRIKHHLYAKMYRTLQHGHKHVNIYIWSK